MNNKKVLFFSLLFFWVGTSLYANDYVLTPGKIRTDTVPINNTTILDIYQHDTAQHSIRIGWTLISNNLYPGWDFSLCVLGVCWTGIPQSGIMDTVHPGGLDGFLGLNVMPNGIAGTGQVRIYVYQVGYETQGDTLTWNVSTPVATGISEVYNDNTIRIFPVPATDVLNIQSTGLSVREIMVGNISGETVSVRQNSSSVPVENLPAGIYFVTVRTSDERTSVLKFSKL
ncbi:MAG: hypothetical protein JWO03_2562 [Bacteroidetes bacterium]|nr:hypothetical protein [Bacteroidota bacterium]